MIKSDFEDLGDNIVSVTDDERFLEYNHADNGRYILDTEKVII